MKKVTQGLIILFVLLCGCTKIITESDLFYPRKNTIQTSSGVEKFQILRGDGVKLIGVCVGRRGKKHPLIYFNGNGETVSENIGRYKYLSDTYNVVVFSFDYRGYGESTGKPTIEHCLKDAVAINDFVAEKCGDKCVVYGRSLGAGMAVYLGSQRPIKGIILESPASTISSAISSWNKTALPWYLRPFLRFKPEKRLLNENLQPINFAGKINCPSLVIHGEKDDIIPVSCGKEIYQAIKTDKKELVIDPLAMHNDVNIKSDLIKTKMKWFWLLLSFLPPDDSDPT
jgi:pimeloyl-ACP methyl ester carboxylesterase